MVLNKPDRLRLVIGPGTGLGLCGLIRSSGEWVAVPTQGGHSDLASNTSLEIEVFTLLTEKVWTCCSGKGAIWARYR